MAIRQFDVGPIRSLQRAAATGLPNLVAIAGPNGAGKSTLLDQLRMRRNEFLEPGSELLFQGAHRTWRSGAVSEVAVLGFAYGFEDVLKQDAIPGFQYQPPQGLHWLPGLARQASSADDAQALVKTAIIRIRNKHRDLLTRAYQQQDGQIAAGSVPDLFAPFAELVQTLLPHLAWHGVDVTNVADIKCYFASQSHLDVRFDIDDLSSGEKAAVALFLPFIEREVKVLAGEVPNVPTDLVPITMLIDEPDLHLHALLQLNVLDYMRRLALGGRAQFIFTTHASALLDGLNDDELFLMSPADLAPENQLSRLTNSAERLELARSITRSTHVLTRAKPIVLVEGEPDLTATASDERLLRLLVADIGHWALVSMAGKSQVVKAAQSMRDANLQLPGIPVFGLVDADTATAPANLPDFVITWPVAMVENLLLDVAAVDELLAPYRAVTGLGNEHAIREAFRSLAEERRDEEIDLRVRTSLPIGRLEVRARDLADIRAALLHRIEEYERKLELANPASAIERATEAVERILSEDRHLEAFHGKRLLRSFYQRHNIAEAGLGWNAFLTELARLAGRQQRSQELVGSSLARIRLYFPPELPALLEAESVNDDKAAELAAAAHQEWVHWEAGTPIAERRTWLRQEVFNYARHVAGERGAAAAGSLYRAAEEIGTPQ